MFEEFPDVMSVKMFTQAIPIGRNATYEFIRMGKLPAYQIGNKFYISKESAIAFLGMCKYNPSGGCLPGTERRE